MFDCWRCWGRLSGAAGEPGRVRGGSPHPTERGLGGGETRAHWRPAPTDEVVKEQRQAGPTGSAGTQRRRKAIYVSGGVFTFPEIGASEVVGGEWVNPKVNMFTLEFTFSLRTTGRALGCRGAIRTGFRRAWSQAAGNLEAPPPIFGMDVSHGFGVSSGLRRMISGSSIRSSQSSFVGSSTPTSAIFLSPLLHSTS